MGRGRPELATDVRSWPTSTPYVLFYVVVEKSITVLRVLHHARDPLHNSGGTVIRGSGWAARRLFAANSPAIGKKNNAADRPSPRYHRPQGVMQRVPMDVRQFGFDQ